MGRRKIPIEKIEDSTKLQITFSKRRNGLFKKGAELCSRCKSSQMAIIVFSPGGKLYSFGHPNAEAVIRRYGAETKNKRTPEERVNRQELKKVLAREWDDDKIDATTDLDQLHKMYDSMKNLHNKITEQLQEENSK